VSQCRALERLCTDRPAACSFVPSCAKATVPAYRGSNAIADPATDDDADGLPDLDGALASPAIAAAGRFTLSTAGCGGQPLLYTPDPSTGSVAPPPVTCPEETRPVGATAPWVGPQPEDDGCDLCLLDGSDVYVNINSKLSAAVALQDATLTRYDSSGSVIDSVRLDTLDAKMDPLVPGEYVKVMGLPSTGFRVARSATMSFMNGSKPYSSISSVIVD
jgi:hypothetical protein